jgi:hypothetical protein
MKIPYIILNILLKISVCWSYVDIIHKELSGTYASVIRSVFGMVSGGKIEIDYSVTVNTVNDTNPYNDFVLFVVVNNNLYKNLYQDRLSDDNTDQLCNFPSYYRHEAFSKSSVSFECETLDRYSVIMLQCFNDVSTVTVDAEIRMMNPNVHEGEYSYLPIEQLGRLRVYTIIISFLGLLIIILASQLYFCG